MKKNPYGDMRIYKDLKKNYDYDFFDRYYDKAKNFDELYHAAGLAISLTIVSLWQKKRPIRGKILLRFQKKFFPKAYKKYHRIYNNLISHSLVLVLHELKKLYIKSKHLPDQRNFFLQMTHEDLTSLAIHSLAPFSLKTTDSVEEHSELFENSRIILTAYYKLVDEDLHESKIEYRLYQNIVDSYETKKDVVDFVHLKTMQVYHEYLNRIKPESFFKNFIRLKCISK